MTPARIPAIVLCDDAGFDLKVAGLTVLDRLVVALHRAGCFPIHIVLRGATPRLKRSSALGVDWRHAETLPAPATDAMVVAGNLLVQPADVKEVLQGRGALIAAEGTPLPLKFVHAGGPIDLSATAGVPAIRASGVARRIGDARAARQAGQELWASLKSSSDGTVDKYFNRPVGRPFSKLLVSTPITPNQISVASIVIGLAGAWFLARGGRTEGILGAILFQLSAIVDCMDGDVARMAFKESPLGKWLDIVGDQVVHAAIFIGVGVGLAAADSPAPVGWLAASAVAGALISFGVILRGLLGSAAKSNRRLQAFIDGATNRDFSVLVLALAVLQKLEWFLWMAAIGSHLFWMAALVLQLMTPARSEPADVGKA